MVSNRPLQHGANILLITIRTLEFPHSISNHSLFTFTKGNDMAYLLLYIDDIVLITSSMALCNSIMTLLCSEFEMKDLGPLAIFWEFL